MTFDEWWAGRQRALGPQWAEGVEAKNAAEAAWEAAVERCAAAVERLGSEWSPADVAGMIRRGP